MSDLITDEAVRKALYMFNNVKGRNNGAQKMRYALEAAAPLLIAAERERCAKVALAHTDNYEDHVSAHAELMTSARIAAAIRSGP
jgi:phage shock protein A